MLGWVGLGGFDPTRPARLDLTLDSPEKNKPEKIGTLRAVPAYRSKFWSKKSSVVLVDFQTNVRRKEALDSQEGAKKCFKKFLGMFRDFEKKKGELSNFDKSCFDKYALGAKKRGRYVVGHTRCASRPLPLAPQL